MPDGIDPRWQQSQPSYHDEAGMAQPDPGWTPPADVAALVAAHQGPVIPPPSLGHGRWWLAVVAVVVIGVLVIAAIIFGADLFRGMTSHASKPQQPPGSPVQTTSQTIAAPSTSSSAALSPETLSPHSNGIVYVVTKSGKTQCQVSEESVICEAAFTKSPEINGKRANEVKVVAAGGDPQWSSVNAAKQDNVTMDYKTYQAQGWTIAATVDGTRFTNQKSKHGVFVSIDSVQGF
jgi:hypothetical protein